MLFGVFSAFFALSAVDACETCDLLNLRNILSSLACIRTLGESYQALVAAVICTTFAQPDREAARRHKYFYTID